MDIDFATIFVVPEPMLICCDNTLDADFAKQPLFHATADIIFALENETRALGEPRWPLPRRKLGGHDERSTTSVTAFLVLFASGCQTGLRRRSSSTIRFVIPASRVHRSGRHAAGDKRQQDRRRVRPRARPCCGWASMATTPEIQLEPGDEPGRLVEGPRVSSSSPPRGNGVVAVDVSSATIVERAAVCDAPRGMAYDSENPRLLVACASGDLVTRDPATLAETQRLFLGPDLRDVIVRGQDLLVTHFRAANRHRRRRRKCRAGPLATTQYHELELERSPA